MPTSSTTSTSTKRLLSELKAKTTTPSPALLSLNPNSDTDLSHWTAILRGPAHTPYETGLWKLALTIPPNYPMAPPAVKFVTKCCHPNVSFQIQSELIWLSHAHKQTGEICLDLLTPQAWTPAYTLASTLEAVQLLLAYPQVDSPLNVDIANVLKGGDGVGGGSLIRFWCEEFRWREE